MITKTKVFYPEHLLVKYKKGINFIIFWSITPFGVSRFIFFNLLWFKMKNKKNLELFFKGGSDLVLTQTRLFKNSLVGLSRKFCLELWIKGVGFKFKKELSHVVFSLGFSHLLKIKVPHNCEIITIGKRKLLFKGLCLQKMTQFISYIQKIKMPDTYLGKGFNFKYKTTVLKPGKKQSA